MKVFTTIVKYVLVALMAALTALTFYQIVLRYVFNAPSSWSEEAVRFLFVYASFIGAGIGIMEHSHIGVDILVNMLPERYRKFWHMVVHAVICVFGGVLMYAAEPLMRLTKRQLSPALKIPMNYIYFSTMLLGALCIIFSLYEIWRTARSMKTPSAQGGGGTPAC